MSAKQVLIIEDDEASLFIYTTVLEHSGYRVQQARTGGEGLRLVREAQPDLVIMDVGLPGTDGFELTRQIKDDPTTRSIPVVAVTVHAFERDRQEAVSAGCDAFFPKPLQPSDLLLEVNRFLSGPGRNG